MSEIQNAIKELSTVLKEITLPASFLTSYDQLECLSHSHGTETYLVQHKDSKNLCVAKCYDRKSYKTVNESGILKSLRHKGMPAFFDEYQDDDNVIIVREYIEGTPLYKYAAEYSLSEAKIITFCAEICDILTYLHGLASCPELKALDVGGTLITSLEALPGQSALVSLSLAKLPIASLDGIECFSALQSLSLHNTGIADLSALKKLPSLLAVSIDETMRGAAEALGETTFDFIYE